MAHTGGMLSWIGRFVFLRFLPRRLLPILTAIEVFRIVRGLRRRHSPASKPPGPNWPGPQSPGP